MQSPLKSRFFTPSMGLVFGILATSSASMFIRFAQQDAPSLVIAAYRLLMATCILTPIAFSRRRTELSSLSRGQVGWMILSGIFLGFHFATWISSLKFTSVPSSAVLVSTAPLWVALLSPIFLKERPSRVVGVGLVIALVGSIVVSGGIACQLISSGLDCRNVASALEGKSMLGNGLAFAGAWFAAFYLLIGRKVRPGLSLLTYTFVVYGSAALTLLVLVGISGESMLGYSPTTFLLFLALAVIPQLLGHTSYNWALKFISAAVVSIVLLGEPVSSTILAFVILKEPPTILEVVGGVLILGGIYIASRQERKQDLVNEPE